MTTPVTFTPIESFFDPTFWTKFYDNKLEVYKLDESGIPLILSYTTAPHQSLPAKLSAYGEYSFNPSASLGPLTVGCPSTLLNFNSFENFKTSDKKDLLLTHSAILWENMLSGRVLTQPNLLTSGFIISYSDLKQHVYTHWSCIPSFSSKNVSYILTNQQEPIDLVGFYPNNNIGLKQDPESQGNMGLYEWSQLFASSPVCANITQHPVMVYNKLMSTITPLSSLLTLLQQNTDPSTILSQFALIFIDPQPNKNQLGWFARNILFYASLLLAAHNIPTNDGGNYSIELIAIKNFRELSLSLHESLISNPKQVSPPQTHTSQVFNVTITNILQEFSTAINYIVDPTASAALPPAPATLGWEKFREKAQPKQTTCKNMDPISIYTQAMDMNLKLLKWQHWPEMPLHFIRNQRCLLIGSGTLGCYVSRLLLGWGVSNITMLDYGLVSASNPVRQPLFTYNDWVNKKYKAHAACEALRDIHPGANLTPVVLSIPSAGTVSPKELPDALESAKQLATLVQQHDVIFLLTDSRASRWLPTLLAQAYGKRTIAAAIGPDTFVAMRHGVRQQWQFCPETNTTVNMPSDTPTFGNPVDTDHLSVRKTGSLSCGCYFCPDQAAPILGIPQSIDQQCTVTRAEVAALASAYAVNLFVQEVSHNCTYNMYNKTCRSKLDDDEEEHLPEAPNIFAIPSSCECEQHSQIRGSVLTAFAPTVETSSLSLPPSTTCVACGNDIIAAYQSDPEGFLTATFVDAEAVVKFSGFNPTFAGGDWEDDEWDGSDDDCCAMPSGSEEDD